MEAIDKLMSHFKNRFPKGNWDKVGDKIKKRYKEFKSTSGGGGKRGKSESASRRSIVAAALAALERIRNYGRTRSNTQFDQAGLNAFNEFFNQIINDPQVRRGPRAQMTLLQDFVNMEPNRNYRQTSPQVQDRIFQLFCQTYQPRHDEGIRDSEHNRENWARNAFMNHRIWMSRLTFAFGIYAAYWAYYRFNRPTAIAQEIVESVLAFGSWRRNKPAAAPPLPSPSPSPTPEQLRLPCSDGFFTCGYNYVRGAPSPSQIPDAPTQLPQLPAPNRTTVQAIGDWLSRTAGSVLSSGKQVGVGLFYVFGSLQDIIEELVDLGAILPGLAAGLIAFLFFLILSLLILYGVSVCGVSIIPRPDPPRGPPGPDKRGGPPGPPPSGRRTSPRISQRKLTLHDKAMGKKPTTGFSFPTGVTGGKRRRRKTRRKKRRTRKKNKRRKKKRKTKRRRRKQNYTKRQIGCKRK